MFSCHTVEQFVIWWHLECSKFWALQLVYYVVRRINKALIYIYHGCCPAVQASKVEWNVCSIICYIDVTIVAVTARFFVACPPVTNTIDVVIDWMFVRIDIRGLGGLVLQQST